VPSPTSTVELPAAWPAAVRAAVSGWAEEAIGAAPRPTAVVGPSGWWPAEGEQHAAVVSVAALAGCADLAEGIARLDAALAAAGELHLVEPVARPGWRALLAASATSRLAPVRGWHLNRDVPDALRAAGLLLTDCDRVTLDTTVWPLRTWLRARAVRADEVLDVVSRRSADHAPQEGMP
jgi:hypothetical protein